MRIAFFADRWGNSNVQILRGLQRSRCPVGRWQIDMYPSDAVFRQTFRGRPAPDAMIFKAPTLQEARRLAALGVPCVTVNHDPAVAQFCNVCLDNHAIGATAARFLLAKGYRRFAFVGVGLWWAVERYQGFIAELDRHEVKSNLNRRGQFAQWDWVGLPDGANALLSELESGTGVMVAEDFLGSLVIEGLVGMGRRVPEEVAVVGVNNDEVQCLSALVPLASVETGMEQVGAAVGYQVERLSQGTFSSGTIRVDQCHVVVRRSAEEIAVDDPLVRKGIAWIHENAQGPVRIDDMAKALGTVRRTLERGFRQHLGRSPLEEVRLVRLQTAQELIRQTSLSFTEIAHRSGFFDSAHLSRTFREHFKMTPTQCRQRTL
jgi:LacI family transcriptional regulator